MNKRSKGTLVAATVAALFLSGQAIADGHEGGKDAQVKCMGVNECKGKAACHTAESSCAGQNSCKGKGWILTSEADCKAKGGKVIP